MLKKQNFIGTVSSETFDAEFSFVLDSRTDKILKFGIFSKRNDLVDQCGSFKMEIGGREIFPEKTDTKEFTTSTMVAVKDKFFDLSPYMVEAGNREIKIKYKNTNAFGLVIFANHDIMFAFETTLK